MNMQINRPGKIGADASRLLVHTPEHRAAGDICNVSRCGFRVWTPSRCRT
jgi:hypothetical protein